MHLDITSDQVGKYVFLPGSVERAALIAEHFDNPVKIAHKREFLTYTGTLEGVPVTVTSTGALRLVLPLRSFTPAAHTP